MRAATVVLWLHITVSIALAHPVPAESAETPRVLAHPSLTVDDRRADRVRHYRSNHEPQDHAPLRWAAAAPRLRQRVLVSAGLSPLLPRTPLLPTVFGSVEGEDYVVEKVYFESLPGWYVTGNLYRPLASGVYPAVLSPHGHWEHGRLQHDEATSVPLRGVHLARMGYVVFTPDMIGFGDSRQASHEFASAEDALWGLGALGLQLWNNIRALDLLQSLPYVDPDRIACTGASGGGTQTVLLSAVDDRVKVSAPVNMLSLSMHGGCVCENAPNLRLTNSNLELAALTAPRPMLVVSATGDWTNRAPENVAPRLLDVYEGLGAGNRFSSEQFEVGHNYNQASRKAMYEWFSHWLGDGTVEPEQPLDFDPQRLTVWSEEGLPPRAVDLQGLRRIWTQLAEKTVQDLWPTRPAESAAFESTMRPVLEHALGIDSDSNAEADVLDLGPSHEEPAAHGVLINSPGGGQTPGLLYVGEDRRVGPATLLVHGEGIGGVFGSKLGELARSLGEAGHVVLIIDAFGVGEHDVAQRDASDPRFSCYNRTDAALAIEDVLSCVKYLRERPDVGEVNLVGVGRGALWGLVAAPLARPDRLALDVQEFDSRSDAAYLEALPLPLLRRWGGFDTCAAFVAPRPMLIHGTGESFEFEAMARRYEVVGARDHLRVETSSLPWKDVQAWLLADGS